MVQYHLAELIELGPSVKVSAQLAEIASWMLVNCADLVAVHAYRALVRVGAIGGPEDLKPILADDRLAKWHEYGWFGREPSQH
jgi:hypothetical protein